MTLPPAVLFLGMASPRQFFEDITKGRFKQVYYFYGSEDYRRSEAEKFVADHFLPDLQRSINYLKIDSKKTSAAELAAALSNLPMLGERQVYVVGNFESYKPKDQEQLLKYIKPKDPNRVIILSTPSAKTPKKTSQFFKTISEIAETVEFGKMKPEDVHSTIVARLAKNKLAIDADALELLIGLVDGDRGGLESELNKLIDFKSEGGSITIDDIQKVCAGYQVFSIFELGDVIVAGNAPKVFKMVQSLLGAGTNVGYLISQLQAHFISLFLVKNGKAPVGNRNFPFLVSKFREQARAFSNQQLEGIIITLDEAMVESRHQRFTEELVLETLIFKLLNRH
mgnify:CR=1 FL=1